MRLSGWLLFFLFPHPFHYPRPHSGQCPRCDVTMLHAVHEISKVTRNKRRLRHIHVNTVKGKYFHTNKLPHALLKHTSDFSDLLHSCVCNIRSSSQQHATLPVVCQHHVKYPYGKSLTGSCKQHSQLNRE
jgi:hypothetical protein